MRLLTSACCAAALAALVASGARADEANKLTYLTFSGAVQIPGMVLPAGTYEFKLVDPSGDRRIVQVSDKITKKQYTILLTIPNRRMKPSAKPVIMFKERPSGEQPAVQAWFYPGETYGYEFVYPKSQAVKIAKASHTQVATTAEDTKSDSQSLSSAKVTHVDENGSITEEGTVAENAPQSAPAASTDSEAVAPSLAPARRELPRTASPLELIELMSGLSFVGAFSVRQLRRL